METRIWLHRMIKGMTNIKSNMPMDTKSILIPMVSVSATHFTAQQVAI